MANRICDNCMNKIPAGSEVCPECGIKFENGNPGGALPNGWVLGENYTIGRYIDIDGEGVTYSAIHNETLERVLVKEFMPVTLCAARDETGAICPKPGCEVLFKTTRLDFTDMFATLMKLGLVEGLVQVLDVLDENNTVYAVLEKIEGPTLAEFLTKREGPVDAARALALMRPVFTGVDLMHANNLVHRGISPDNIILESGGTARLCGFATLALRQQGSELKAKLYNGYSAPEQYAASEFEGRYTDIYALGAVLYRLVTGVVPHSAEQRRVEDILRPARALNKEIPTFLSAAIGRAMRVAPAERIQNVPDLRLALAGEGGKDAKGPLGLTKQQLMIGGIALAAVVVVVLIILLVSLFTSGNKPDDSSSSSEPSSSQSVASNVLPDFTGKRWIDIGENKYYTDLYLFAEPEEVYSMDVEAGRIISQVPLGGTVWDGVTPIRVQVSKGVEAVALPNLTEPPVTQEQAEQMLKDLKLEYEVKLVLNNGAYEPGDVVKTEPPAGTELLPGIDKVVVHVADKVTLEPMPNLVGQTQAQAESTLTTIGVQHRFETVANDGTQTPGTVYSTEPPAGSDIAVGATIVNVYVYDKFYMPSLDGYNGKPVKDLTSWLDTRWIKVQYTIETVANTDAAKTGTIQSVVHTVNAEVTTSTVVTIKVYGEPPASSSAPPPVSSAPPVSSSSEPASSSAG